LLYVFREVGKSIICRNQGITKDLGISKISKKRKFLSWLIRESVRPSSIELLMGDEIKEILKKRFLRKI